MFRRRLTLFKLLGFEVRIDAGWAIIGVLLTWSLAVSLFPALVPGYGRAAYVLMGLAGVAGFFASLVFHELAHAAVARYYRMPIRAITLFLFGGVAEMEREPESPKRDFLVAAAGPLASALLGGVIYAFLLAAAAMFPLPVTGVLVFVIWVNWVLAIFNLAPTLPLDGGRILLAAIWRWTGNLEKATRIASEAGTVFGLALMGLGLFSFFSGHFVGGLWYFLIGFFLRGASQASYFQELLRKMLQGERVRRFMKSDPVTVPAPTTVQELVDNYIYRYDDKMFPVVAESGVLTGCVSASDVQSLPRNEWSARTVQQVARPCSEDNTVAPDADALDAVARMRRQGINRLLVAEHDHVAGVLSLTDVMNYMARRLDLERGSARMADIPRA